MFKKLAAYTMVSLLMVSPVFASEKTDMAADEMEKKGI